MDNRFAVITAPSPVDAPTAPVAALAGAGAGNVENGTHSYKVTYTTAGGGETTPSVKSNVLTVVDKTVNGKVSVTLPVGANPLVTGRKLYRTVTGDGGAWKLVATVADNTTLIVVDNIADGSLGANAPTVNSAGETCAPGATVLAAATLLADGAADATAIVRENDGAGRVLARLSAPEGQRDESQLPVQFAGKLHVVLTGGGTCLLFVP